MYRHLPYAEALEAEANIQFENLRRGFAEVVARREFGPGFRFWCNRLVAHVSLYKFSFSRNDHVNLCKLLLEVLLVDGLDYSYQERIAGVLRKLIRKPEVLPSTALVIPWRPLYDLLSKLYFGKLRGTTEIHKQHGQAICQLIREARRFFAPEATAEIMATLRPLLCPHDETIYRAACFMYVFIFVLSLITLFLLSFGFGFALCWCRSHHCSTHRTMQCPLLMRSSNLLLMCACMG